jgi:cobyrinic acid a,c-diamide synthase
MLGYREVLFEKKSFLPHGKTARGHEFHYSELIKTSTNWHRIQSAYGTKKTEACEGYLYKNCLASYAHLHFGSNPEFARKFVRACKDSRA